MPHFLDLSEIATADLRHILQTAQQLKKTPLDEQAALLPHHHLVMLFEKPSTRTRVSFEVGVNQLGGHAILLDSSTSQLGRGESVADTAQVLSRYGNIIMVRCFAHETLLKLAKYATIPVINGLTNHSHPCQVMADILTFIEHRGTIAGAHIAWIGDGNNVAHSWIHAASHFGFDLHIATPEGYAPDAETIDASRKHGGKITLTHDPYTAAKSADLILTDCWVSMGDSDAQTRMNDLTPYKVDQKLMDHAKKDALFMHCLPAHRGEEVSDEVIDSKQSVVFDEAENRLHAQKAIMLWALEKR